MHTNSRFAVAVHAIAFIAAKNGKTTVTSEMVAESVNTNPVVIRRILGALREAHLATSQPGSGGGWALARRLDEITLRDIYCAVEETPLFAMPPRPANAHCMIGRNMQVILSEYFDEAEQAMQNRLAAITLAQVMDKVTACCKGMEKSNTRAAARP